MLVLALVSSLPLPAGTIVLTNDYVLEGRIDGVDEDGFAISTSSGRVTVHGQFVARYTLDPGDRVSQDAVSRAGVLSADRAAWNQQDAQRVDSAPVEDVAPRSAPGEVLFAEKGVALVVPPGLSIIEDGRTLLVRGEGRYPSLSVHVLEGCLLSLEEAREQFREVVTYSYPGVRLKDDRLELVDTETAYTFVGEYPSRHLAFRQTLVRHGDLLVVIGLEQSTRAEEKDLAALRRTLRSLRFVDQN